jgi:hypothetical protein
MSYLKFTNGGKSASGKTDIFEVRNADGSFYLGQISWMGGWRKYCFFPYSSTTFDPDCLREIADFCEFRTRAHKEIKREEE